jgi:hypothetical protein
MEKCCFIIFAHSDAQNVDDVNDMIDNINHFHKNADFIVLHPTMKHPKTRLNVPLGLLNQSSFIFGPLTELIKDLKDDEINQFDHFCLVSANQYFINDIIFEKNINYAQFNTTENFDNDYTGKDMSKEIIGFPIKQPYLFGKTWDDNGLYKELGIELPMISNWECVTFTKEVMLLCKKNLETALKIYPNRDLMNVYIPYMILLSKQQWDFIPHFGTYDPSNPNPKNYLITIEQTINKRNENYFSIKRVNYGKNCHIKNFVRENFMINQ